jgi:RNA polymerase sigma-70 factor, ECF subfamily
MQMKAWSPFTPALSQALTNEQLVERVLSGDAAPFELLIRRNNGRVYRAVRSLLRTESEIEDVMQAVYVLAYAKLASFRGEARFSTWLTRIAMNETLGRLRQDRRHPAVSLTLVADADVALDESGVQTPEADCSQRELALLLEAAVDDLPELYRVVFVLREVEGMDTAEAAAALGVSEDVVKTRLSRARGVLRDKLEGMVGGAVSDAFGFHATRCDRVVEGTMALIGSFFA